MSIFCSLALALGAFPQPPQPPAGFIFKASGTSIRFPEANSDSNSYETYLVKDQVRSIERTEWVRRNNLRRAHHSPLTDDFPDIDLTHWAMQPFGPGKGVLGWTDGGEWGGGIEWTPPGGKLTKISEDNTSLVVATRTGIYAIQGLDHLMFWYGRLVKLTYVNGRWRSDLVTDLHVRPNAPVWDGKRFFYTALGWVSMLRTDGMQREIFRANIGTLQVDTMSIRRNGELWLGCVGGVLCLSPRSDESYQSFWYVPKHSVRMIHGRKS